MAANLTPLRVTLNGTAVHDFRSKHLPQALRVEVGLPPGYEHSTIDYPAVYLIDGYWYFPEVFNATTSLSMADELPPVLVIGLGYEPQSADREAEYRRVSQLRCRDLTPTHDPTDWWRAAGATQPLVTDYDTGGAESFLSAVEDDVKAHVRSHYRVRRHDEVLAGFSLGGLFSLNTFFTRPDCFGRYVCGSPSLWWQQGVIFNREAKLPAQAMAIAKDLFVSVGALESQGAGAPTRMVENMKLLAARLSPDRYPNLRNTFRIFEGETHATAAAPAFAHGLKAVFSTSKAN